MFLKPLDFRFPIAFQRLFTRTEGVDAASLIHFREQDGETALSCPENWNPEAAAMLADTAAFKAVPAKTKLIEENTVPSWLWRKSSAAPATTEETNTQKIFDRVIGSAAYKGWKENLFDGETSARAFYEETRYALAQRFIALEPRALARLGLDWAYGNDGDAGNILEPHPSSAIDISNGVIDAVVGGSRDKTVRAKWQKATHAKHEGASISLRFSDIAADWNTGESRPMHAAINIMAFRHNDGTVNIDALRHAVRLLVVLLNLHGEQSELALGFTNLASLLMALAIPYDSDAARATAASMSAIITAEAYAISAELASLQGASAAFTGNRESILRKLRNHRRAAYGEVSDYEKISVLPVSLTLEACPDLALAAAARSLWDDTLQLVQILGSRYTNVTTLTPSPDLAFFMECSASGAEPMRGVMLTQMADGHTAETVIHPSVTEALSRLDCDTTQSRSIIDYVLGTRALDHAPHINPKSLSARGFDQAALDRVAHYLPQATDLRFVFTPWILGEAFCRKVLKITAANIENPHFDILHHLGFSKDEIAAANATCYGHKSLAGNPQLTPQQASIFALQDELAPEAFLRMAAAVQPHISGDTGLHVHAASDAPTEKIEQLLLAAWRQGIKSITISYDNRRMAVSAKDKLRGAVSAMAKRKTARKIQPSAFVHAQKAAHPARKPSVSRSKGSISLIAKSGKAAKGASRRNWSR